MVSVTSTSRYITSASRYHSRYRSRSSMYIRGLIPRNFAELDEAVPIGLSSITDFVNSWVFTHQIFTPYLGMTDVGNYQPGENI